MYLIDPLVQVSQLLHLLIAYTSFYINVNATKLIETVPLSPDGGLACYLYLTVKTGISRMYLCRPASSCLKGKEAQQ